MSEEPSTSVFPLHTTAIDPVATRFTRLRRKLSWFARLHQPLVQHKTHKVAMLTLTYRAASDWNPRHVSKLINHVRSWLKRRRHPLIYCWVLELQQRGAPHYHILLWLPKGLTLPKPDKQGWWPHGQTRIEWARSSVGYLMKYASKLNTKFALPPGARLFGVGCVDPENRATLRWLSLPQWFKGFAGVNSPVKRRTGGGFLHRESGETWTSPFRVDFIREGKDHSLGHVRLRPVLIQRKPYTPDVSDVRGPYSLLLP